MKFCLLLLAAALPAGAQQDAYTSLRLYDGGWTVTMHDAASGNTHTDTLVNACALAGHYFVCQQTVNGKVSALVVFIPASTGGHYAVQNVLPDGSATGRSDLEIAGSQWIYSSQNEENGKTTWYRTTNDFRGNDRIHFESARSGDGKTWTVTISGDETRGAPAK